MFQIWSILGVICLSLATAQHYENETIFLPDIKDILKLKRFITVSDVCEMHLKKYLDGIFEKERWALEMSDSITKFPDGIYVGHFIVPGLFDECVNAANEDFSGKHCMASLKIKLGKDEFKPTSIYRDKNDLTLSFSYGLCIPSTCNASEINNIFAEALKTAGLDSITVEVKNGDCSTSDFRPLRTEDKLTIGVLIMICLLAVGSTCYEIYQTFKVKNEKLNPLWSSFSLLINGKALFRISQSSSQLKCLHGIRFFSMCWVIICHSYFSFLFAPAMNPSLIPKFMKEESFVPISNGFVSVDSFFLLSGLLVCLVFFRDIAKKRFFDVPVAFIHRYMRLTPPFAILMLIQATIVSRIGNGPFWNSRSDAAENACRESWWSGLLYLQNYIKPSSMCLGQAWYLSADMQMFWVSPLILYPILWFPAMAPYFLLLLLLVATFTSFAVSFVHELPPNLFTSFEKIKIEHFEVEYVPFHTRMAPWLVGIATGYIICGIQAKKIQLNFSKLWAIVGWTAACFLLGGSLFGITRFISNDYTQIESSFYLAFHRVGWSLGLAWVIIACVGGYGGPINDFLSLDLFQPLAKLSYCNFLIHMTLQNYRINSSRTNQYIRHFEVIYAYSGDILISNLISVPVVLLFEFPFANIDRHYLQKLQIFPWPRPKLEKSLVISKQKSEKVMNGSEDLEKGNTNSAFTES